MTQPTPPPAEQPQAPPPAARPPGSQAEVVAAALAAEELAITPALSAFMVAVLAYARGSARVLGSPITVAKKVGYYALVFTALRNLAQRSLDQQRSWSGPRAAEELWAHQGTAESAGVEAGLNVLAEAAKHIVRSARADIRQGGNVGLVSPAGSAFDPAALEEAPGYTDVDKLALTVVQNTKHAATLAAAGEAGWTRKTWVDRHDTRVRVNHAFLGAKDYEFHTVPLLEPFVTLDDNKLWFPGDTSAPVHEWIRCRCWLRLSR